jgi:cobalt-zinc-cadmium efflux system protein
MQLALSAVPANIDALAIDDYLRQLAGVTEIHDLHIWGLSTTESALTVHLVMRDGHPGNDFLCRVAEELHDNFTIGHVTIQIELDKHHCSLSGHT